MRVMILPITILALVGLLSTPVGAADPHNCNYCHGLHNGGSGTLPLTGFNLDSDLCLVCHDVVANPSYPTAPLGMKTHTGALHSIAGDTTSCWDCHDHYGETVYPNDSNPTPGVGNDYLIPRFRPADPNPGNTWKSRYPLSSPADQTVFFTPKDDTATNFTYAYGDGSGLCEACHESTLFNTADGANPHQIGDNCADCHDHTSADGFAPSGCTGCHNQVQDNGVGGTRRAIMSEFDATSHHVNWVAAGYASAADIPSEDCEVCHNQATHKDEVVDLNDVDTGVAGAYRATVASELATFCIKCHDGDGALAETVPLQPFTDGMKPPVIDGNEWLTNTKHGANFTTSACLECHVSGHGRDLDTMLVVCETCHGASGTPIAATRVESHFTPSDSPVNPSDIPCEGCHTPHTNLKNKFYTNGTVNSHTHYDQSGTVQSDGFGADGYNIMLYGRQDDGDTSSTKLANPMRIIQVTGSGTCALGNTQVEMYMPNYLPDGEGVVFTPVVGDRIRITSSPDPNFNGYFRILETDMSNVVNNPPKGWICYDNPNTATHSDFAWVSGFGWWQRPEVVFADYAGGDATVYFSGPTNVRFGIHGMVVGDTINVIGVTPIGYSGQQTVTAVTEYSVSFTVSDPGAFTSGGFVEWVGSVKEIKGITVSGPPPPPDINITLAENVRLGPTWVCRITLDAVHGKSVSDTVTVTGVTDPNYDGTHTISRIDSTTQLAWDCGNNGWADSSGGTIPGIPTGGSVLVVELNTNSNSLDILNLNEASGSPKDGDIVRIYGAIPSEYNERWEVDAGGLSAATSTPPTITLRCPPKMRTALGLPACDPASFGTYSGGGILQSTGTLRETVFDARGSDHTSTTQYLGHDEHSFATQDIPTESQDGYLYGPCELCHTSPDISKHRTIEYGTTHNNGRTCTTECHFHVMGFDKANITCDRTPCFTP